MWYSVNTILMLATLVTEASFKFKDLVADPERFCPAMSTSGSRKRRSSQHCMLEGEALAELSEDDQKSYATAKKKMAKRIMPTVFATLDEFHKHKSYPGESLSLFVYELKRLLDHSMPGMDAAAHEQLLLHQFLGGLPSLVVRAAGEIKI